MRTEPIASLPAFFGMTDEQAMWRVQTTDDEGAFGQLVTRWEGPIRDLCVRMIGDLHRGQDLTQEAFTRVFARRKEYQPASRFSTWLWRIALNLCYDELRRLKRRQVTALDDAEETYDCDPALVDPLPAPDRSLADKERGEWVRAALLRLAEPYRSVLVLRHYENLKFREIAEVLDVPEGTVKSRMAEALTQLERLLGARPVAEARPAGRSQNHEVFVL